MKLLNELKEDIKLAEKVLAGEYCYCKECDDYYLTNSFFEETKTEKLNEFEYALVDFIGNDEPATYVDRTYRVCPKGHKTVLSVEGPKNE